MKLQAGRTASEALSGLRTVVASAGNSTKHGLESTESDRFCREARRDLATKGHFTVLWSQTLIGSALVFHLLFMSGGLTNMIFVKGRRCLVRVVIGKGLVQI